MPAPSFDQIRRIASDVLGISPKSLTPESSPETIEAWDSVQHLNLVLAIEQQFDLEFDPEEVDSMKTLGAMAAAVDQKAVDHKALDHKQDRPGA
jgi:acyl carrier protein